MPCGETICTVEPPISSFALLPETEICEVGDSGGTGIEVTNSGDVRGDDDIGAFCCIAERIPSETTHDTLDVTLFVGGDTGSESADPQKSDEILELSGVMACNKGKNKYDSRNYS